jgi:hypothetical protein
LAALAAAGVLQKERNNANAATNRLAFGYSSFFMDGTVNQRLQEFSMELSPWVRVLAWIDKRFGVDLDEPFGANPIWTFDGNTAKASVDGETATSVVRMAYDVREGNTMMFNRPRVDRMGKQ